MSSSATDTLGNAGPLHTLKWEGKEYPIAFPCLNTVKRAELHVVRYSLDSLNARRPTLTPAEYAASRIGLEEAMDAREFAAEGRLWNAVMGKLGGLYGAAVTVWACVMEGCEQAKPPVACPLTPADLVRALRADDPEVVAASTLVVPDFFALAGEVAGRSPADAAKIKEQFVKAAAKQAAQ